MTDTHNKYSTKIRKVNCKKPEGIASCLRLCGFSVIPLKTEPQGASFSLRPAGAWKTYQEEPIDPDLVYLVFRNAEGVAIATGKVSNVVVLDVDDPEAFNSFYPLEKAKDEAGLVIQTKDPNHCHLYFEYDETFSQSKSFLKQAGFEIKANGGLANFWTRNGSYKIEKAEGVRPLPEDLKQKIFQLYPKEKEEKAKDLPEAEVTKKILEILEPYYQQGQRQNFVCYVAGTFRKAGIPVEVAISTIQEFLKSKEDEEVKMRIEAIKHTYQKPIQEIAGLTGIESLEGVSEETILRIKSLLRKAELKDERLYKVWTAEEIAQTEFPEPQWLIPSILPEGISLLAGRPKVGKSWLALLFSVELAKTFRDKKIVYLALEDTLGRLKNRLKVLQAERLNNLLIITSFPRIGKGGWELLREISVFHNPLLIVIDPWIRIRPQAKKGTDLYWSDYEAFSLLKDLTSKGISILVVHHKRKGESDDPIEEVLGTTGITGAVDSILSLKRQRGSNVGTLELIARDFQEKSWGLSFEDGKWIFVGDAKEVAIAEEQKRIIEAIQSLGGKATPKQVASFLGKNESTVKVQMWTMFHNGQLRRDEKGNYYPIERQKEDPFLPF